MPTINSPTPDATSTTKGKLQLAGDLTGTAAAPSIVPITPEKRTGGFYATVWDASALGTGTKTITGIGFTPKALIVLGNRRGSSTQTANTTGYCYLTGSTYVQGHQASGSTTSAALTITSITQAFGSTTQSTTQFLASVTGFSSDTITVNVTTNTGDAAYCAFHIIVFG
jgi:hypothetical protein